MTSDAILKEKYGIRVPGKISIRDRGRYLMVVTAAGLVYIPKQLSQRREPVTINAAFTWVDGFISLVEGGESSGKCSNPDDDLSITDSAHGGSGMGYLVSE